MIPSPPSLRNWLVFGSETEPGVMVPLRAGPLQLLYDPTSGFIRRIRLGTREVLRGIYAAVRDCNWSTVPATLRETKRELTPDSFHVEFDSEHRQGEVEFFWRGSITGHADGRIRYDFDGEARTTFLRSRIGFCVLHPVRECAGARARQRRVDGSVVECRFPEHVEPQIMGQARFRELRTVAHEIADGLWAEVEFEGDVFEMEDQRNWTDASFKTYCTPLVLPFPVEIKAGTHVRQCVTLRLAGVIPRVTGASVETIDQRPEIVTIAIPERAESHPLRIGLGMASYGEPLTDNEIARLRQLQPVHLRVDVRLSEPGWPALWERAIRETEQLGTALELALHLPPEGERELKSFQQRLQTRPPPLARVLALRAGEPATTLETLRRVRQCLAGVDVPIGAGSDANFCELNRERALGRLPISEADFIFWSMNPQVHAFDPLSIVETLESQPDLVQTARSFAGGKPLVISPVTLKPRFNAVAASAPLPLLPGQLPSSVDPRQISLFAAAWTLGSVAAIATAGAASVTLYETTGWRGVMEREGGSPWPEEFPSISGGVFPLYQLLSDSAGCQFHAPVGNSEPSQIAALIVVDGKGKRSVLIANLEPRTRCVHLGTSASAAQVRVLHADTVAFAAEQPENFRAQDGLRLIARDGVIELFLPPYALARISLPDRLATTA